VTSINWYFRKKDELLDAMTDRALAQYEFTAPGIDASNWRESLRNHARTMRRQFLDDPVLCDLVLIRGHYGMRALHGALHEIERTRRGAGRGGANARTGRRNLRGDLGALTRGFPLNAATVTGTSDPPTMSTSTASSITPRH
jgi:AcrR family transcriptional regulator